MSTKFVHHDRDLSPVDGFQGHCVLGHRAIVLRRAATVKCVSDVGRRAYARVVQRLLYATMRIRDPDTARAVRTVVLLVLVAEALAAAGHNRRGPRSVRPGQAAPRPRRPSLPRRGALAGRRPRG